jgi:hypothetical protein
MTRAIVVDHIVQRLPTLTHGLGDSGRYEDEGRRTKDAGQTSGGKILPRSVWRHSNFGWATNGSHGIRYDFAIELWAGTFCVALPCQEVGMELEIVSFTIIHLTFVHFLPIMQVFNDMPQRHAEKKTKPANDMYTKHSAHPLHSPECVVTGTAPVLVGGLASRGISAFGTRSGA